VEIDISYGQGQKRLVLSKDQPMETVSQKKTHADPESVTRSLSSPTKFAGFDSFISARKKLVVVVNDHTRPTPTAAVLRDLGLRGKDVSTIIACGAHRSPNQQEIEQILGGAIAPYGGRLLVHDARDKQSLIEIGSTSRGTKLLLNHLLFESDGIIVVGSVEPHYFAGYTGGRKFLLPALAGLESIVMNHALSTDDNSGITKLEGNPVHEDFMEALQLFGRYDDIFSIQLVLTPEHQVSYTSSGHVVHSFFDAVQRAKDTYVVPVRTQADIVISVAKPPMDIDLYQSQKAIENVRLAVKKGGIIILVSNCRDGIGDRGFYELLASKDKPMNSHTFGFHKAVKMAKLLEDVTVFVVSDLPAVVPRRICLTPFTDVQEAVDKAIEVKGKESRVLTVLDGSIVVPIPADRA